LTENPESLFAYSILARLAIFEKRYPEAIQYYQKILDAYPESDRTLLNIAETYALSKNPREADRYTAMAKPSARKKLYKFFIAFSFLKTRLLWWLLMIASLAVPYLFLSFYILTTIILAYVFIRFGSKKGDLLIVRAAIYFQAIHSIFFIPVACELISRLSLFSG
jgi:tetratricopeptide (TPR) repeat protein